MQEQPNLRRNSPRLSRIHRAAASSVLPFNRNIQAWQRQAALLRGRLRSGYLGKEDQAIARAEAGSLTHQIVQQVLELERVVAALPEDVRTSTRISDTFRSMHQVTASLRQTLLENAGAAEKPEP